MALRFLLFESKTFSLSQKESFLFFKVEPRKRLSLSFRATDDGFEIIEMKKIVKRKVTNRFGTGLKQRNQKLVVTARSPYKVLAR